jgi:hypothetical protein
MARMVVGLVIAVLASICSIERCEGSPKADKLIGVEITFLEGNATWCHQNANERCMVIFVPLRKSISNASDYQRSKRISYLIRGDVFFRYDVQQTLWREGVREYGYPAYKNTS